jgi:hypothetical protein
VKSLSDFWPLIKPPNDITEEFKLISKKPHFIKIIGNIKNWGEINSKMYNEWVLPNAIILFGKPFYNKKIKNEITNQTYDDNNINKRAEIFQISQQIDKSLQKYGSKEDNLNIEQYILKSLRNLFADLTEHRIRKPICPMCLNTPPYVKTYLDKNGEDYFCERCKNICKNWMLYYNNPKRKIKKSDILNKIYKYLRFIKLQNVACVCPNNQCVGKFIPVDFNLDLTHGTFIEPPDSVKNTKITCPYCDTFFVIGDVIKKSGFKQMSGCLTGLPQSTIFEKMEIPILEERENNIPILYKDFHFDKLDLVRKEIILRQFKNNPKGKDINKHLYNALNNWIIKNYDDAYDYFFLNKSIDFSDILIHFINSYKKLDKLNWLCRPPYFSGGPIDTFKAVVKNNTIPNNTSVRGRKNEKPKILKVYSLMADRDYVDDVLSAGQTIKLKNSKLKNGDEVLVTALLIPPKTNNSMVQKIIRLKKELESFILTIEKEEETGMRDNDFWNEWNKMGKNI